jgi:streptogramin lyase
MRRKKNNIDITKVKWSHPMGLKSLSHIFDVHRNTMSKWLKDQTICNRQLSPRRWEVAMFELPYDLTSDNIEINSLANRDEYF